MQFEKQRFFDHAECGRLIITKLKRHFQLDDQVCWVILPTNDEKLNRLATGDILFSYLTDKYISRCIVLLKTETRLPEPTQLSQRNWQIYYQRLTVQEIDAVLSYYRLVQFASDVHVACLEEPFGCPGWIGNYGITLEEYVRWVIFYGRPVNWMWWNVDNGEIERNISSNIRTLSGKKVYLYGLTRHADNICQALYKNGLNVTCVLDSNSDKTGWSAVLSLPVQLPEGVLLPYDPDAVIIIVSKYAREMRSRLAALGYFEKQILEIPIYGSFGSCMNNDKATLEREFEIACDGLKTRFGLREETIIPSLGGTGDVYWICTLLPDYLKRTSTRSYALVLSDTTRIPDSSCIASMFRIVQIRALPLYEIIALFKAWEFFGSDFTRMKPDLHLGSRLIKNIQPPKNEGHYPAWRNHLNCMRYQYFFYPGLLMPALPEQKTVNKTQFDELKIKKRNTVVLSPYANAFQSILKTATDFWERLATELLARNYAVCTNCTSTEKPVKGTIPICPSYEELASFLNYAGYFVAIRSGICDIACTAHECRMILLYEKEVGIISDTFSLYKMGVHPQAIDLEYNGSVKQLLEQVLNLFPLNASSLSDT